MQNLDDIENYNLNLNQTFDYIFEKINDLCNEHCLTVA